MKNTIQQLTSVHSDDITEIIEDIRKIENERSERVNKKKYS